MRPVGWWVLGIVAYVSALWTLAWFTTFRPRRRRLYHRLFPRRSAMDKAWLVLLPCFMLLFVGMDWAWTPTPAGAHVYWWRVILVGLGWVAFIGVFAILNWRAYKAKEPTWWRWSRSLPARPDSASSDPL